jgi:hypothetical protein
MPFTPQFRFFLTETYLIVLLDAALSLMMFLFNRMKQMGWRSSPNAKVGRMFTLAALPFLGIAAAVIQLRIVCVARNRAKVLWEEEYRIRVDVAARYARGVRMLVDEIHAVQDMSSDEAEDVMVAQLPRGAPINIVSATGNLLVEIGPRNQRAEVRTGEMEMTDWVHVDGDDRRPPGDTANGDLGRQTVDVEVAAEQQEAERIAMLEARIGRILFGGGGQPDRLPPPPRRFVHNRYRARGTGESSNAGAAGHRSAADRIEQAARYLGPVRRADARDRSRHYVAEAGYDEDRRAH